MTANAHCHGPASTLDNGQLTVIAAHVIRKWSSKKIAYNIIKASNTSRPDAGRQFSVTDPTTATTVEPDDGNLHVLHDQNFGEAN